MNLPSISIAIPTLNEEEVLPACLRSLVSQNYPQEQIDIAIVDAGSTDATVRIASMYGAKILDNTKRKDPETAKMIGLNNARGELFLYIDADIEFADSSWLRRMVLPFIEVAEIMGSYTKYVVKRDHPSINRSLSYHPSQCDPLLSFFYPVSLKCFESSGDFQIFRFWTSFPPIGVIVYRTENLKRVLGKSREFLDVDVPIQLIKAGFNKFAYVPNAGLYHLTVADLHELIKKRIRNLSQMRARKVPRYFTWFNSDKIGDWLKIVVWLFYSNTMIVPAIVGIAKSLKYRDSACMFEVLTAPAVTDAIIFAELSRFLTKNKPVRNVKHLYENSK